MQPAGCEMLQPQLSTHAVLQVAVSVANHQQDLPDRVHAVAVLPVEDASRDALTAAWTSVVQEQGGSCMRARSQFAVLMHSRLFVDSMPCVHNRRQHHD
jgi:hypothetical protein